MKSRSVRRTFVVFVFLATATFASFAGGAREADTDDGSPDASAAAGSEATSGPAAAATEGAPGSMPRPERELLSAGIRPVPGFTTDFSRSVVNGVEIIAGGPPKDGIPAIDDPRFVNVGEVTWLGEDEPVLVVTVGEAAKIYPLQILTYHEIVNDTVGGIPLAVTFCPLCNTGIVFRRDFDGLELDFGTTGRLRFSNLIMYDRQTETWWQQATGEGLVGRYAGYRLDFHPVLMLPWDVASERFADAPVLSRDTGYSRSYGTNPYAGYDTLDTPFLYRGPEVDRQFNPLARVIQVIVGGETLAVAYPVLEEERLVQRTVGGVPIVVLWEEGTASALDTRAIREGRDVGSANAFQAQIDGRALTFRPTRRGFEDEETGTLWDATGRAVRGELVGRRLNPVVGIQHFWFSHNAFLNDGIWRQNE